MDHSYWQKQTDSKPLFPDILWNKPERRDQAGRLAIVGGNKLGFSSVAAADEVAKKTGIGATRILLPDVVRKSIPPSITDVLFGPTTPSGSLSRESLRDMRALSEWSNGMLLVGDAGRNSETAILYEEFISKYEGPLTITRDAIDLVKNNSSLLVERPDTLIVASFAQVQKIFQAVYYPKMLVFSMQLMQLVEALHKFTITYPCTILTLHKDTVLIAHGGEVVTQEWSSPMLIWRGDVATKAATFWIWNPSQPLESITASLHE
ncbi:hypothetical protein H6796_00225 [Candidatus Nomurabacteria bacterium]|nr:hypothetical protein [Candidatus Nomurabacteria bacterium]